MLIRITLLMLSGFAKHSDRPTVRLAGRYVP
jgi:hypothetical protein